MKHRILRLFAVLLIATLTLTFAIGLVQAQSGINYSPFSAIRIWQALKVHGFADVDGATTLNGTLDVDGATTLNSTVDVDGAATLNSDATVADDFIISPQTVISVTNGGVITPTGTYQPLESAGTVTPTLTTWVEVSRSDN